MLNWDTGISGGFFLELKQNKNQQKALACGEGFVCKAFLLHLIWNISSSLFSTGWS